MSRPPLLAVAFCALAGCVAPSLDDIESKMPHACDGTHACATGYDCVAGTCRKHTNGQCTPGEMSPCGSDAGECRPGLQVCLDDGGMGACEGGVGPKPESCNGKDDDCNGTIDDFDAGYCERDAGVCAAARRHCLNNMVELACTTEDYGPTFEMPEVSCDGLDNDCDGQIDVGLTQQCPLNKGVCNGATVACSAGSYPACTAANYGPSFDSFEFRCDGMDNDCDGQIDVSRLLDVSQSGGMAQHPTATATGQGTLLVLYERLGKVAAQVVNQDGTVSSSQSPATSVDATSASFLPKVTAGNGSVVAAWVEQAGTNNQRVMLALLDLTGRSKLTGGAAVPIYSNGTSITALAVAYSAASDDILTAIVDNGALHLIGTPGNATGAPLFSVTEAPNSIGKVAAAGADTSFALAFEDQSLPGVRHCNVSLNGTVTCGVSITNGKDPSVRIVGSTAAIFQTVPDAGGAQLTYQLCDAGACGPLRNFGLSRAEVRSASPLELSATGTVHFAVWEESGAVWFGSDDGGASLAVQGMSATAGFTPLLLGATNATPAWVVVDTAPGVSGVGVDEIAVERRCLP